MHPQLLSQDLVNSRVGGLSYTPLKPNSDGYAPGSSDVECGNCLLHDLPMARREARKYLEECLELL